jgi:hypothetical protein
VRLARSAVGRLGPVGRVERWHDRSTRLGHLFGHLVDRYGEVVEVCEAPCPLRPARVPVRQICPFVTRSSSRQRRDIELDSQFAAQVSADRELELLGPWKVNQGRDGWSDMEQL